MTMTTKHTPGPWTCNANYVTQHYMVWDADGNYHEMRDEVAEMDANARLIAAAPDLLAALETLTREWDLGRSPLASEWSKARAAIALANGPDLRAQTMSAVLAAVGAV